MKNTIRKRLVTALLLASVWFCFWSAADEVSKARLGSLKRNDYVVTDVRRGVETNDVLSLIGEYDRTVVQPNRVDTNAVKGIIDAYDRNVIMPREAGILTGAYDFPVKSVNSKTGDVVLAVGDIDGAVSMDAIPVKSVNSKTGDVVLAVGDIQGAVDEDRLGEALDEYYDDVLLPEFASIVDGVNTNLRAIYRTASNNYLSAYIANVRAFNIEAWQYTNSVTRADIESGFTQWAVTPIWAVGGLRVARIQSGPSAGKWSLFPTNAVEYGTGNALVPLIDAPADATRLSWPSVSWVDPRSGTNLITSISIEARRTRLMDMSDYAKLLGADDSVPASGWAFQQSESSSFITNYTGVATTNVVGGVTNIVEEYTVSTNKYAVLSLYKDGSKVWTSDPSDSSNTGWLITLALLLTGGVGAFAWKNYAPKSYVDELVNYKPISISSLTVKIPGRTTAEAEIGETISAVTLSYSLSKEAASATLNSAAYALAGKTGDISLTGLSLTSNTAWTLAVTEPASAAAAVAASSSKSVTLPFRWRRYWGVAEGDSSTVDDVFLNGGTLLSELSTGKGKSFTVNADGGKYIWYAVPASFGSCSFKVGGFDGGFTLVKTFEHTNSHGGRTTYNVYRSDNPDLGGTTVTVS